MFSRINAIAACLVLALVTAGLIARETKLMVIPGDPAGSRAAERNGMADFQDVVFYPTRAVREGINPYDAGDARLPDGTPRYRHRYAVLNLFPLYSPLVFVLFGVFSIPDFTTAVIAWGIFNYVLLLIWSRCCLKWAGAATTIGSIAWLAALMLVTQAGRANFLGGETAIPLALGSAAALAWADRKPMAAGWALALTSFKPTFGLPLGIFLALLGKLRVTAIGWGLGFVIGAAGLLAIFARAGDLPRFVAILRENQAVLESDPDADALTSAKRIDAPAAVERLLSLGGSITGIATAILVQTLALVVVRNMNSAASGCERVAQTAQLTFGAIAVTACMYRITYVGLLLWGAIVPLVLAPEGDYPTLKRSDRLLLAFLTAVPMINVLGSKSVIELAARLAPDPPPIALTEACWTLACTLNGLSLLTALVLAVIWSFRSVKSTVSSH